MARVSKQDKFICDLCGADKEEELFSFTQYGDNPEKKLDLGWYCLECFEDKELEYEGK